MRETWYGKVLLFQMAAQPSGSSAAANGSSAAHAISLAAARNGSTHSTTAKSSGIEVSASEAAGTGAPIVVASIRAGQDTLQYVAEEQKSQHIENSRSKASGWSWSRLSSQLHGNAVHSTVKRGVSVRPDQCVLIGACCLHLQGPLRGPKRGLS